MARVDPGSHIKALRDWEDRLADGITAFAGNMKFVYFHIGWFGVWLLANLGLLGAAWVFDSFPFGLLTMIVSLEAIFLSTFVLISQNRATEKSEIRAQLDYETDVQSGREIELIMQTLVRMAQKQGVEVKDLEAQMAEAHQLAKREADRRVKG